MTRPAGTGTPKAGHVPRVLVMMATYNGADWVVEQLDSILAQQGVDVFVRVCDDRSTDGTFEVCRRYAREHERVRVTQNEHNLGVALNFMQMVYEEPASGFDCYAFSDQDDVWLSDKLITAARAIDACSAHDGPVLYYADMLNVGPDGERREMLRFADCERHPGTVLVRNYVNGCAMVWNARLQELARTFVPAEFPRIHDVWLHMLGRYCGTVIADYDHVLSRRRITGKNVVGETQTNLHGVAGVWELAKTALPPYERACTRTARLFCEGFSDELNECGKRSLGAFLDYANTPLGRFRILGNDDFWLPTAQMRARMRAGFVLGFY